MAENFKQFMLSTIQINVHRMKKNQTITDKKGFPVAMIDYSLQTLWKEYIEYKHEASERYNSQVNLEYQSMETVQENLDGKDGKTDQFTPRNPTEIEFTSDQNALEANSKKTQDDQQ